MSESPASENNSVYARIARAIDFLVSEAERQPSLSEAAAQAAMSPAHFTRVFRRMVGVSPKRFLSLVTLEAFKQRLAEGATALEAQLDAGLSSAGRVHDHFLRLDAVSPGEYRRQGAGLVVRYGFHEGPLGDMLVATTDRGLCFLAFTEVEGRTSALGQLSAAWPGARLLADAGPGKYYVAALSRAPRDAGPLSIHVRGSNFQVQVWRALLRIPEGVLLSYGDLASAVGRPRAVRAVASAVGANPVACFIPCHRVIRRSGGPGGYRWSMPIKFALISRESISAP
ncbi:methylated-DNA--[protein]-cysteine S-methyltransferase [Gammaproteobacteria bacterium AB-CW1]|uniref:Methylated-DNA--[protein]-cysteine S-methyltransferase n=1 Tax=Natronospira elongata TaxID=3110268 RepID=A0AAP6JJC8_9GAMM|nr:methylated-DNA--[protein]-cysteine S-methyltransferase [Gammaproteobacteria bacterium AB-CW1]